METSTDSLHLYSSSIESLLDDESKVWHCWLQVVEQHCGVRKVTQFALVCTLIVLYLMFGLGAPLLCNLIGVLYPARQTLYAMGCPNLALHIKWLTYWLIYAALSVFDHFSSALETLFPFYWLMKCMFLVWCMSDMCSNGSSVMFSCFFKPLVRVERCFARECVVRRPKKQCVCAEATIRN